MQFLRWPGKDAVVGWLDQYCERVLQAYRGVSVSRPAVSPSTPSPSGLPWARLTTSDLLRIFRSESWDGQLDVNEFSRVLQRLLYLQTPKLRGNGSQLSSSRMKIEVKA